MKSITWSLLFLRFMLNSVDGALGEILQPSRWGTYSSVSELYQVCGIPSECGKAVQCEGLTILLRGSIDYNNIFDHSRYPQLPYEKFFLTDLDGKVVEVLVVSLNSPRIFRKISEARNGGLELAFVKGVIRGMETPVMGTCRRLIRLEMHDTEDIFFE